MNQADWDGAQRLLEEALLLEQALGHLQGIAFKIVKLGQVAEARGDRETALARYREGLAVFQRLGMPRETQQVQAMIAQLEALAAHDIEALLAQMTPEQRAQLEQAAQQLAALSPEERATLEARARLAQQLQTLVQQAHAADERRDASAIGYQEQAVTLARQLGDAREAQVQLSILLYNLAGYYGKAGRHAEAVTTLAEVVALDEATGHPDLAADRQALAQARERAEQAEKLAQLSPEERAKLEEAARQLEEQLAHLTPAQRQALEQQATLDNLANQVTGAAQAVQAGQIPAQALLDQLLPVAQQVAHDEKLGDGRHELVSLFQAITGLLQGEPGVAGAVRGRYAGHWAELVARDNL